MLGSGVVLQLIGVRQPSRGGIATASRLRGGDNDPREGGATPAGRASGFAKPCACARLRWLPRRRLGLRRPGRRPGAVVDLARSGRGRWHHSYEGHHARQRLPCTSTVGGSGIDGIEKTGGGGTTTGTDGGTGGGGSAGCATGCVAGERRTEDELEAALAADEVRLGDVAVVPRAGDPDRDRDDALDATREQLRRARECPRGSSTASSRSRSSLQRVERGPRERNSDHSSSSSSRSRHPAVSPNRYSVRRA